MNHRHRELLRQYSHTLQQSIDLNSMKEHLRDSKIFTVHMLQDIYEGKASFFEELPTRGPEAFSKFIHLLKMIGHTPIADELCHVANSKYQQHGCSFISYNNGFSGILSSEDFQNFETGCKIEARALDQALLSDQCGYENYRMRSNLSAYKLKSKLKKFSEIDFTNVNSCIIIILTLGVKNNDSKVIYDKEGKCILLHDIVNLFRDSKCPTLKYKPKIFLLSSFDMSHKDSVENVEILPDVNDTFLWYFPSFKSYKHVNKCKGKYFGEILSSNLKDNYQNSDFETIFKSSYSSFINQFDETVIEDLNITEYERLGKCREKICFT